MTPIDLSQLLTPDRVIELAASTKQVALVELCDRIATHPHIRDAEAFREAILEREALLSTGIGLGVAVPHAKVTAVSDYAMVVGRQPAGIEFDALDGQPVRLIFLIGAAERQAAEFVRVLAAVVRMVKDGDTRLRLLEAATPDEFVEIVREATR